MAWDIRFQKGLWLPQLGWWLDAHQAVAQSFVSHAHSDHMARHREVLCTPATARLMDLRLGGRRKMSTHDYDRPFPLAPGAEARLRPAGHILGSAQLEVAGEHGTLLYTGDFNLRPGLTTPAAAAPRADVLIMETTFGLPRYVLPPSEETRAAIVAFCREAIAENVTPVLLAYSLGKAQELALLLAGAGLPLMLHPEAARLAGVYRACGIPLPPPVEFDPVRHPGHVVVTPAQASLIDWINPRRTAVVTGWAVDPSTRFRYGCDAAFPLSDHCDFDDLLRFVGLVQPRVVYTLHGFAREFAATLRRRGVEAWALGEGNQLELSLS